MIRVQEDNVVVSYTDDASYVTVDLTGFLFSKEAYLATLNNKGLLELLAQKRVENLMLNGADLPMVGTDFTESLEDEDWLEKLASLGIKCVRVVLPDATFSFFENIIPGIESNAAEFDIDLQCFGNSDFLAFS